MLEFVLGLFSQQGDIEEKFNSDNIVFSEYQKLYLYMKGMWLGRGGGELFRKFFLGKILYDFCQGWKGILSRKNSICKSMEVRENMIKVVWLEIRLCKKKMREEIRVVGEFKIKRIFFYQEVYVLF